MDDGSGTKSDRHTEKSCMSQHMLTAQSQMRTTNILCDACIRLDDGGCIYVHRVILCAACDYFRALFMSPLNDSDKSQVHIKCIRSDTMQSIIDFAYSRSTEINEQNVTELITVAHYFGLESLVDQCAAFIMSILKPENCISLMLMTRRNLYAHELQTQIKMYVLRNFNEIAVKSQELLELPFEEFYEIISDDILNAKDEEPVWECCLQWIKHDEKNRLVDVGQLLQGIRLGLMNMNYFFRRVKDHAYVQMCPEARPILIETLQFMANLNAVRSSDDAIITPFLAIPRLPHDIVFTIGGWYDGSPRSLIEAYDTRADRWIEVEQVDPAGARAYHGATVIGHKIYCIGGYNGGEHFNTCRMFDVVQKVWKEIAPMHSKRCYVSVCTLNGMIYAIGGHDGISRLRSVERYCPVTNQWTFLANMTARRSDADACALNGKIYVIGGFDGTVCLQSAEVYDVATDTWSLIGEMSGRRSGLSCVAFKGKIYAIGGFNGSFRLSTGERYDPEINDWSLIREMCMPRSNFGIEVIDDMIFVFGGFNGSTTIDQTECYIIERNEWLEATSMTYVRSAHTASAVSGLPNVNDYVYKNRKNLLEERRIFLANRIFND